METKKNQNNQPNQQAQSTTKQETPKRYSKTWEAILKYHGTTVVNDPTLLL